MEEDTKEVGAATMTRLVPSDPMPQIHPACDAYPLMPAADLEALKLSIREKNQAVPCVIWNGFLLDGRNRWKACAELARTVLVEDFYGPEEQAILHVGVLNSERRHLTTPQKVAVGLKLSALYSSAIAKEKAKKCADAGEKHGARKDSSDNGKVPLNAANNSPSGRGRPSGNTHTREADEIAAKALGVSRQSIQALKAVDKTHPELTERVRSGDMSVRAASIEAKRLDSGDPKPKPEVPEPPKSAPKSEPSSSSIYRAKVCWSSINRGRRNSFAKLHASLSASERKEFWSWAEEKAEDGE
jgi:hypothetical protein